MKIKYSREFDLDLDVIADVLIDAITDQLDEELGEIAESDIDAEYLEKFKPNIKNELYPILNKKLMCWRINND